MSGFAGLSLRSTARVDAREHRRDHAVAARRLELKQLYHALFRSGLGLRRALEAARKKFTSQPAITMMDFLGASKRGVCADRGDKRGET